MFEVQLGHPRGNAEQVVRDIGLCPESRDQLSGKRWWLTLQKQAGHFSAETEKERSKG